MTKTITKVRPRAAEYVLSTIVTAAAFAAPIADGGWENLAAWILLIYAWPVSILLFVGIFCSPLEKMPDVSPFERLLFNGARLVSVAWLAYHGMFLAATLLALCFVFAAAIYHITKSAYEAQNAPN